MGVTITDQTLWSPSRSRAQRENQSRSPTDQATPSSAPSPPSSSLSSLPSPSRSPLVHTSQTSSTPSCLPNTPFIQFLPSSLLPALQHLLQIIIQSLHVFPSPPPPSNLLSLCVSSPRH